VAEGGEQEREKKGPVPRLENCRTGATIHRILNGDFPIEACPEEFHGEAANL
jgi:hypothetical protein